MSELMRTETIIFDSSVILELDLKGMKNKMEEIVKGVTDTEKIMDNYNKALKKYQRGQIKSDIEFFNEVFKGLRIPQRKAKNLIIRHDNWRKKFVKLNSSAKSVLELLSRNYKIGLISNMPKPWFNNDSQMLGLNHKRIFHTEIFSMEVGIMKPDMRIFTRALSELFAQAEKSAYVTNHEKEAKAVGIAGMQVIYLGKKELGDYNIKDLKELLDLFGVVDEYSPQETKVRDK